MTDWHQQEWHDPQTPYRLTVLDTLESITRYGTETCEICRKEFEKVMNNQITCSEACSTINSHDRDRRRYEPTARDMSQWEMIECPEDWKVRGHVLRIDDAVFTAMKMSRAIREAYRGCTFRHRMTKRIRRVE